jgi:hypothetical protein
MTKRGRPPKNGFALLDQIPETDLPQYILKRRQAGLGSSKANQELINGYKELIKDYRKNLGQGKFISDDLILLYSEIGGENLTSEDNVSIKKLYEGAVVRGKIHQAFGTKGAKRKAGNRAKGVWHKQDNKDLLRRIKSGSLTLNGAISKILADWSMRGDGTKLSPTIPCTSKTLYNWYYTLLPKTK